MVYHEKENNCLKFISRHRIYSGQHNQYDIRAAVDGKYTRALLYSDWLYFFWHGINGIIFTRVRSDDFKPIRIDFAMDRACGTRVVHCSYEEDSRNDSGPKHTITYDNFKLFYISLLNDAR